ncbi:MAG: indole-3-glycerol phosphate synthase TrpC [Clostridia bacterium]|nr:indole-3-glycerol phosphate synthase TrpC [Clostridia bacterium]
MNILEKLADLSRRRVLEDRTRVPEAEMRARADALGKGNGDGFLAALKKPGISFICEIKKASPSKGLICPEFPYLRIAEAYEQAGADCISCLTEPEYFLGSDRIFREIREKVRLPMLRKDFTVSPYQLDQARVMGADAALLIVSLLDRQTLESYLERCELRGIAALTETHNEEEIRTAVAAGAKVIGVNNRNLKDFTVDFENAARLRDRIPAGCIYVAESGVKTPEDVQRLEKIGADAALIGETLMRAEDPAAKLRELKQDKERTGERSQNDED